MKKSFALFLTSIAFKIICFIIMVYNLNNNNYSQKAVSSFVYYLLLTEICLSINFILLSKQINFLQYLIQFYFYTPVFWCFLLWTFGCTFNQFSIFDNCITIIYFGITTSKTILASHDNKNKTKNNINEIENIKDNFPSFQIYFPTVIPKISFSLLYLCLSSAFYLLDWNEKWQIWPIPSSVGIFFGSLLDDFILFFFSWKKLFPSPINIKKKVFLVYLFSIKKLIIWKKTKKWECFNFFFAKISIWMNWCSKAIFFLILIIILIIANT